MADKKERGKESRACSKCGTSSSLSHFLFKGLCRECRGSGKQKTSSWTRHKKIPGKKAIRAAEGAAVQAPPSDTINHPPHYTRGKIEVIEFIEDQGLGYHDGNVVKYICRHRHKGAPLDDLKKARWYLDRLIKKEEQQNP